MSQERTYQGFRNYVTWCIALWLDNDHFMQEEAARIIRHAKSDYAAANALKEWIEEQNPVADQASMWNDIMGWALQVVDWGEVVEHCKDEDDEPEEDESEEEGQA